MPVNRFNSKRLLNSEIRAAAAAATVAVAAATVYITERHVTACQLYNQYAISADVCCVS